MVSIILPTYNSKDTIERAISSVIFQNDTNWELIIIDDKSTDKTYKILDKYKKQLGDRLTIITNEKNLGAGLSRRKGISIAKGEFITFLDSDDELQYDFLSTMLYIQKIQNADIVWAGVKITFPPKYKTEPVFISHSEYYLTEDGRFKNIFDESEMKFITGKLYRKSLFDKCEFSDKRVGEDYETLFYLTYYSESIRTTKYVGYIHNYRENSLLADKGIFYRYVKNAKVSLNIIDFLKSENRTDFYDFLLSKEYMYHLAALNNVRDKYDYTEDEFKECFKEWFDIVKWFNDNKINTQKFDQQLKLANIDMSNMYLKGLK